MKKLALYAESAGEGNYYRALFHLAEQKRIDLKVFDHKGFRWFGIKLWHCSPFTRVLVEKLTGKRPRQNDPTWGSLLRSMVHPFRLLQHRNIVAAFAPCSIMGFHLLFLKLVGKNMIYYTSWPFWDEENYVHKPRLGSGMIWKFFLKNTRAVCVTRRSAEELARLGADVCHIPHSVDVHSFVPPGKRDSIPITLLHVGRVVEEKGLGDLCAVFESLLKTYPHLRLVVVGDGPEMRNVEDREGVVCKGHLSDQKDLVREYQTADIFVLNSFKVEGWEELFGIALVEAMACGLPCVATDCVGPRELVQDGVNGFVIPQKNRQALYQKLEQLILDPGLRAQLGGRARQRAMDFALESNARKWLDAVEWQKG